MNMCLSSMKNVCEVAAHIRVCKIMKYGLFLQGFLQQFCKFIHRKNMFSEKVTETCQNKIPVLKSLLRMSTSIFHKMFNQATLQNFGALFSSKQASQKCNTELLNLLFSSIELITVFPCVINTLSFFH